MKILNTYYLPFLIVLGNGCSNDIDVIAENGINKNSQISKPTGSSRCIFSGKYL
jgi:hypothetical protein